MSWHKRSIQLILGFPLALPIVTYAVNVGETYIQSGQNEPLNASINVSDIDPKSFSVKIATPEMYKQLGLSDEQAVSAKFEPTSSNGGKIVLTTTQPVATPYADVVLNIENKGEKNLLPKTLLMPINGSQQVVTQPQTENAVIQAPKIKKTIAKTAPISLPQTSLAPINEVLPISTQAPPDLVPNTSASPTPALATTTPTPNTTASKNLVIQETRRVIPVTNNTSNPSTTVTAPTISTIDAGVKTTVPEEPKAVKTQTKPADTVVKPVNKVTKGSNVTDDDDDDTTTYIIQRNDSLWSIASKIAKRDGKNVHQVMQDIIDENPDAFEDGDPTRMTANTELDIPNYNSVPSQTSIKNAKRNKTRAIAARKAPAKVTAAKATTTKANKTTKHVNKKSYRATHASTKTTIHTNARPKPARKAHLSIVSATQSSGSAQGNHPTNTPTGRGSSGQMLEQVKQRRAATANQAARVNQLNGSLSSSEQRLKIQNEKLAMLEKRLKELNSQ